MAKFLEIDKVEIPKKSIVHFELNVLVAIPQNDIHFRDWHLLEIDTTNCEMVQDSPPERKGKKSSLKGVKSVVPF